jgi:hydrogenase expression/formation protein HypD
VFFAVGFETTAPANAMAVHQARREGLTNFTVLVSHVLVPPAMEAILRSPLCRVQGFLAAGHVCAVMGLTEYRPLAERYRVPIVVTGFEPLDILQGITMCVQQLEESRAEVENQYARSVRTDGNPSAIALIQEIFQITVRKWRGLGEIPHSGLALRDEYAQFDAERRFDLETPCAEDAGECISGLILQGLKKPPGVRRALHAGKPAGRDDGLFRRRLCRVLPLSRRSPGGGVWPMTMLQRWRAPCRSRPTASCNWRTAAAGE